jgi:hypothetical protein
MIPPPEIRFTRIILLVLIVCGGASLFIGVHVDNVMIAFLLAVVAIPILVGINKRKTWSLYAAVVFLFLLGLPSAVYLCTTVPWYMMDCVSHPERSSIVPDVLIPASISLVTTTPFWLAAAFLLRRRARLWVQTDTQEVSNQRPQGSSQQLAP